MTGTGAPAGPEAEYRRRLASRRASAEAEERRHRNIGAIRFLLFTTTALLAWAGYRSGWNEAWLLLPAALFIGLAVQHARVARARRRFELGAEFYARGLRRLDGTWPGTGERGERFLDPTHPYAADLDIFGRGSLFELLCTARTGVGQDVLASWLSAPAEADEVRARQAAVRELRERLDLRENLALGASELGAGGGFAELTAWASGPPVGFPRWAPALVSLLGAAGVVGAAFWAGTGNARPFAAAAALSLLFAASQRRRVLDVVARVERPGRDLLVVGRLLERLRGERFEAPRLRSLQEALRSKGAPAELGIARLRRLIELLDSGRNALFAPLAAIVLWNSQLAMAVERWRLSTGPAIPSWLRAVGEMEALSSLASHAYEHPADPFPQLDTEPVFEGSALAHPLLSERLAVRNDVLLVGELRLLVVSGSNMSGKSTLLRTVGCNTVLALAGAPVRAERLRLGPLGVGASIRTVDSIQDGASRFYAEITRLRDLVAAARGGPRPLLFLLDELLHGTNSHDRRIGAEAVLRTFVALGALGLVTTHDLALGATAEALAPRAANVHFEDRVENGLLRFDYRMRPGVVERSNALELMRSVGLEV